MRPLSRHDREWHRQRIFSMFGQGLHDFYNVRDARTDTDGLIEAALIPLTDMVLYPNMVTPLFIERERSLAAITATQAKEATIIAVAQINASVADPTPDDL